MTAEGEQVASSVERFTEAEKLRQAGVTFCIAGNGSGFGAPSTRNLPYHAAMAAAFGLPKEEALRAVTLYPAQILGVGRNLGSIEVGKSASLMLTDGDPLEITTQVERVFIDGPSSQFDSLPFLKNGTTARYPRDSYVDVSVGHRREERHAGPCWRSRLRCHPSGGSNRSDLAGSGRLHRMHRRTTWPRR